MVWLKLSIAFAIALLFHASVNIAQDLQEFKVSPAVLAKPNKFRIARGDLAYFFHNRPRIAIVNKDGIRICDLEDGRELNRIPFASEGLFEGALSSNDQMLAFRSYVQGKAKVVCVELLNGEILNEIDVDSATMTAGGFAISRDGDRVAVASFDGKVAVYSTIDGGELGSFQEGQLYVSGLAFGEKTDKIAVHFNSGKVVVRDGLKGKVIYDETLQHQDFAPVIRFVENDNFLEIRSYRQSWEQLGDQELGDDLQEFKKLAEKNFEVVSNEKFYATYKRNTRLEDAEIAVFERSSGKKVRSCKFRSGVFRMKELSADGLYLRFTDFTNTAQVIDLSSEESELSVPTEFVGMEFLPGENRLVIGSAFNAIEVSQEKSKGSVFQNYPFVQRMRVDYDKREVLFLPYNSGSIIKSSFSDPLKFDQLKLGKINKELKLTRSNLRSLDFLSDQDEPIVALLGVSRSIFVRNIAEGQVVIAKINFAEGSVSKSVSLPFDILGKEQEYALAKDTTFLGQVFGPQRMPEANSTAAMIFNEEFTGVTFNQTLNIVNLNEGKIVAATECEFMPQLLAYLPEKKSVILSELGGSHLYEYSIAEKKISSKVQLRNGPVTRAQIIDEKTIILSGPFGVSFVDYSSMTEKDSVKASLAYVTVAPDNKHIAVAGTDGSIEIVELEKFRKTADWTRRGR